MLVEYLVAKGTIDDRIWKLVQSKLTVLNAVGLSKDSFRSADTKNLPEKAQQTIPEMISKREMPKTVEAGREEPSSTAVTVTSPPAPVSKEGSYLSQTDLFFEDGFDFGSVEDSCTQEYNLNTLDVDVLVAEAESCSEKKRLRLDDAES